MTEKILPSHQIGLKWKDDQGNDCETVMPALHESGKRKVKLIENTWTDIGSVGAIHYYVTLRVYSPSWSENGDGGGHGGYGGKNKPNLENISFDAERVITGIERDANGDLIGKVGETTYRFNDPKTARQAGIEEFKKRFGPGWVLVPEYLYDGEPEILAET